MSMPEPLTTLLPGDANLDAASDPTLTALLGMLDGAGAADPLTLLRAQFETRAQTDPRTAAILRFLEQRRVQQLQSTELEAETEQTSAEESLADPGDHAGDTASLQDLMDQVYSELEVLRVRNDTLAAALGACHLCFGEDALCENCGGGGVPGSRPPELAAFRKYVLPAVRRAQAIDAKRGAGAPLRQPSPRQPENPRSAPG